MFCPAILKAGKVLEDPAVLERVVDDREQFTCGRDDRLAGPAPGLDALVEGIEVARVSDGNERALNQRGAHQLVAAFGDPPPVVGFVRLADARDDAHIGSQLVGVLEVIDVADPRQEHGRRARDRCP